MRETAEISNTSSGFDSAGDDIGGWGVGSGGYEVGNVFGVGIGWYDVVDTSVGVGIGWYDVVDTSVGVGVGGYVGGVLVWWCSLVSAQWRLVTSSAHLSLSSTLRPGMTLTASLDR